MRVLLAFIVQNRSLQGNSQVVSIDVGRMSRHTVQLTHLRTVLDNK
jgi:hypothetical protein